MGEGVKWVIGYGERERVKERWDGGEGLRGGKVGGEEEEEEGKN